MVPLCCHRKTGADAVASSTAKAPAKSLPSPAPLPPGPLASEAKQEAVPKAEAVPPGLQEAKAKAGTQKVWCLMLFEKKKAWKLEENMESRSWRTSFFVCYRAICCAKPWTLSSQGSNHCEHLENILFKQYV